MYIPNTVSYTQEETFHVPFITCTFQTTVKKYMLSVHCTCTNCFRVSGAVYTDRILPCRYPNVWWMEGGHESGESCYLYRLILLSWFRSETLNVLHWIKTLSYFYLYVEIFKTAVKHLVLLCIKVTKIQEILTNFNIL